MLGCGPSAVENTLAPAPAPAPGEAPASPTSTPAEASPTGDSTPDEDTGDPLFPAEPTAVRFVAIGDAGEGNLAQYEVGDAVAEVCAARGCDFALYLGDNFYDSGVSDVDDELFRSRFELPYAKVDFPFYVVLGNHDLGFDGIGLELWKAPIYVEYTARSAKSADGARPRPIQSPASLG